MGVLRLPMDPAMTPTAMPDFIEESLIRPPG
jgi:hypothetical protein